MVEAKKGAFSRDTLRAILGAKDGKRGRRPWDSLGGLMAEGPGHGQPVPQHASALGK